MSTIIVPRGSTKSFIFTVEDDGGAVDLSTCRIYLTAKYLGEGAVVIAKANTAGGGDDNQIEVIDATHFRVKFIPADTSAIATTAAPLFYDAWIVTAAGQQVQLVEVSHLKLTGAVTTIFPT